ncbi:MAG TPA: sigma factor-like helix-turn-helix DNA-binding protein [Kofleriaceae bacterium]|jgi:RNA polymerase sigma-70 factor (ECF subfamily)|nr:sigma factor-like helix-turn-helix DNA-binding protein [Kofleriaceae bacterium]
MNGAAPSLDASDLQAWAASAVERGRAAWPGIAVSGDELAQIAALHLSGAAPCGDPSGASSLDAAELYLAAGCARGDRAALAQFRARYLDVLAAPLRRMGLGAAQIDDVWQVLCTRLLVGAGDRPPRIVRYAGAGRLAGLVRVAATRLALNWLEREPRGETGDDWLDRLPATATDPELHVMKREHRASFKQELEAAIQDLSSRQRMVLRLHLVERLGIDAIAAVCSIHRATAARQIALAKETLAIRVRLRLVTRWKVSEPDLPALKSLVDSQLDLSLQRLLAGDGSPREAHRPSEAKRQR